MEEIQRTVGLNESSEHRGIINYDLVFIDLNLNVIDSVLIKEKYKELGWKRFIPFYKTRKFQVIEKNILENVSGVFRSNRFTAIMGPSGAGKTSLLSQIAGQLPKNTKSSGKLMIQGRELEAKEIQKISGFVFQDDVILETMTVEEALKMSVILRLPPEVNKSELVEKMVENVSLKRAKKTQIGSAFDKKGISGGERKRTSIAMELITEPKILFLDEPTSGLDSFTAYSITKLLVDYAHLGHSVIATIHQPSTDIFNLFDDLLLLHEGRVVFYGEAGKVIGYFEGLIRNEFPKHSNPADYIFMHILRGKEGGEMGERWEESELKIEMNNLLELESTNTTDINKRFKTSFWIQFKYLLNRASKNAIRNELIIKVRFFQSVFIGLLAGLVFMKATDGSVASQIQSISGVLYFLSVNQFFGSATAVLSIFASEKMVFLREYRAGYYSLEAYYMSKVLVELPYQIIFPAFLLIIAYYIIGLNPEFTAYLLASVLLIFCAITGTAIGTFISAIFDDVGIALAVLPLFLLPVLLFSGLFVNSENFPVWLAWLQYGSPVRYSFSGLLQNQFDSYTFNNCDPTNTSCSGKLALNQLGFGNDLSPGILIAILAAIYLIFVLAGYLILLHKIKQN